MQTSSASTALLSPPVFVGVVLPAVSVPEQRLSAAGIANWALATAAAPTHCALRLRISVVVLPSMAQDLLAAVQFGSAPAKASRLAASDSRRRAYSFLLSSPCPWLVAPNAALDAANKAISSGTTRASVLARFIAAAKATDSAATDARDARDT